MCLRLPPRRLRSLTQSIWTDAYERTTRNGRRSISEMKGLRFECIPSHANFVMVHLRTEVAPVIQEFWKKKILVGRPFPPMNHSLRVSLGTDDEMKRFYAAFRQILR